MDQQKPKQVLNQEEQSEFKQQQQKEKQPEKSTPAQHLSGAFASVNNQASRMASTCGNNSQPTDCASYSGANKQKSKLILPTTLWIILLVLGFCFISLLSSLNHTLTSLDSLIRIERQRAQDEKDGPKFESWLSLPNYLSLDSGPNAARRQLSDSAASKLFAVEPASPVRHLSNGDEEHNHHDEDATTTTSKLTIHFVNPSSDTETFKQGEMPSGVSELGIIPNMFSEPSDYVDDKTQDQRPAVVAYIDHMNVNINTNDKDSSDNKDDDLQLEQGMEDLYDLIQSTLGANNKNTNKQFSDSNVNPRPMLAYNEQSSPELPELDTILSLLSRGPTKAGPSRPAPDRLDGDKLSPLSQFMMLAAPARPSDSISSLFGPERDLGSVMPARTRPSSSGFRPTFIQDDMVPIVSIQSFGTGDEEHILPGFRHKPAPYEATPFGQVSRQKFSGPPYSPFSSLLSMMSFSPIESSKSFNLDEPLFLRDEPSFRPTKIDNKTPAMSITVVDLGKVEDKDSDAPTSDRPDGFILKSLADSMSAAQGDSSIRTKGSTSFESALEFEPKKSSSEKNLSSPTTNMDLGDVIGSIVGGPTSPISFIMSSLMDSVQSTTPSMFENSPTTQSGAAPTTTKKEKSFTDLIDRLFDSMASNLGDDNIGLVKSNETGDSSTATTKKSETASSLNPFGSITTTTKGDSQNDSAIPSVVVFSNTPLITDKMQSLGSGPPDEMSPLGYFSTALPLMKMLMTGIPTPTTMTHTSKSSPMLLSSSSSSSTDDKSSLVDLVSPSKIGSSDLSDIGIRPDLIYEPESFSNEDPSLLKSDNKAPIFIANLQEPTTIDGMISSMLADEGSSFGALSSTPMSLLSTKEDIPAISVEELFSDDSKSTQVPAVSAQFTGSSPPVSDSTTKGLMENSRPSLSSDDGAGKFSQQPDEARSTTTTKEPLATVSSSMIEATADKDNNDATTNTIAPSSIPPAPSHTSTTRKPRNASTLFGELGDLFNTGFARLNKIVANRI